MLDRAEAHSRGVADRVHRRARIALGAEDVARRREHLGAGGGAAVGLAASGFCDGRRHSLSSAIAWGRAGSEMGQKLAVALTPIVRGRTTPAPSAPPTFRGNPATPSSACAEAMPPAFVSKSEAHT